MLTPAAETKIT